jgi:muconolactone delta-isomerase
MEGAATMQLEQPRTLRSLVRPLIGIAFLTASGAALGQQPPAAQQEDVRVALAPSAAPQPVTWSQVRIIRVKGDRIADFEARLKELSAAMSEQGRGFNVWQVVFGEQNTYHIVSQLASFASLPELEANPPMEQAQWTSWLERIRGTIDSQVMGVAEVHTDLSMMPQDSQATANAELLILATQSLLPGKRQEFVALVRDQLIPAFRKSSILGVVTNEMAFGSGSGDWVFAVPVQSWAELDKPMPLITSMGQQAAEALLARVDSMTERSETIVLLTRPDLSAVVAQAAPQSAPR